ncbi:MAG: hypothetical protein WC755_07700 [Candidatus Woesearchaeota archaeon]|jgi:hypothetical protein
MIIIFVMVGVFIAFGIIGVALDYFDWNDGICKKTGKHWEYFDTDSQDGHGYKSDEYRIWISWGFDKNAELL